MRCVPDRENNSMVCEVITKTNDGETTEAVVRGKVTDLGIEFEGEEGPTNLTNMLKDHMRGNIRIKRKTGEF